MDVISKNYGNAGGTLDSSKYLAAAISKLCTPSEAEECCQKTYPGLQLLAMMATKRRDLGN